MHERVFSLGQPDQHTDLSINKDGGKTITIVVQSFSFPQRK